MRQDRVNKQLHDCKCVDYGQIDPKKIERLRKHRQKQICTWKELSVFRDDETKNDSSVDQDKGSKPMFPPIFHVSMKGASDYNSLCDTADLNSSFGPRGKKSYKSQDGRIKTDVQKSRRSKDGSSSFSSLPPL